MFKCSCKVNLTVLSCHCTTHAAKQEQWQHPTISVCPGHGAGRAQAPLCEGRWGPLAELLCIHVCLHCPWSVPPPCTSPLQWGSLRVSPGCRVEPAATGEPRGCVAPPAHPGRAAWLRCRGRITEPTWNTAVALACCSCSRCCQKWLQMTIWLWRVCCEQFVGPRKPSWIRKTSA